MTWRKFAPSDTKWDCIETHKAVYSTKTWRLDTSSNNNILRCISNWCACYFLNMDVFALLTKTTTGFCSKHCVKIAWKEQSSTRLCYWEA